MLINYWDCKYQDYYDNWDGDVAYLCSHRDKCSCDIDNKFDGEKAECPIAEILEDDK